MKNWILKLKMDLSYGWSSCVFLAENASKNHFWCKKSNDLWLASFSNDGNSSVKKTNKTRRWAWNAFFFICSWGRAWNTWPNLVEAYECKPGTRVSPPQPLFLFYLFFSLIVWVFHLSFENFRISFIRLNLLK